MRISVHKWDKGFREDAYNYKVYLGKKNLPYIFTADEEEKVAYGYKLDSDGEILTINHEPITQVYAGDIRIVKEIND